MPNANEPLYDLLLPCNWSVQQVRPGHFGLVCAGHESMTNDTYHQFLDLLRVTRKAKKWDEKEAARRTEGELGEIKRAVAPMVQALMHVQNVQRNGGARSILFDDNDLASVITLYLGLQLHRGL